MWWSQTLDFITAIFESREVSEQMGDDYRINPEAESTGN